MATADPAAANRPRRIGPRQGASLAASVSCPGSFPTGGSYGRDYTIPTDIVQVNGNGKTTIDLPVTPVAVPAV
jgi:hypothetical protein